MFNKQNGYEGELSLVANEVKKKKKTYAVQKKKKGQDWSWLEFEVERKLQFMLSVILYSFI